MIFLFIWCFLKSTKISLLLEKKWIWLYQHLFFLSSLLIYNWTITTILSSWALILLEYYIHTPSFIIKLSFASFIKLTRLINMIWRNFWNFDTIKPFFSTTGVLCHPWCLSWHFINRLSWRHVHVWRSLSWWLIGIWWTLSRLSFLLHSILIIKSWLWIIIKHVRWNLLSISFCKIRN